jgi:hypothetical protein
MRPGHRTRAQIALTRAATASDHWQHPGEQIGGGYVRVQERAPHLDADTVMA